MKNNWKVMKIEEIGEVVNGGTPSTKKEEYWGGDIAWITPKDLSNYNKKYISKGERSITQLGLQNSSAKIVPPKTVLLTSRAPIGYLAIAQNELSTNQGFKSIICNENIINYNFLYYLLKTKIEEMISIAGGSTFKEISTRAFKSLEIKVPPLKEQIKISNILSIIDSKIELNNQINEKLEETAKAIYNEWFVNFNFPDENGLPYKDNGGEFVDSELGKIPVGWEVVELKSIFNFQKGKKPIEIVEYEDENYLPYITLDAIRNNNVQYAKNEKVITINELNNIMVMDGASSGEIYFGYNGVLGSTFSVLNIYNESLITSSILYYMIKSIEQQIKDNTTGSAIPHTDKELVYKTLIAIPKNVDIINDIDKILLKFRLQMINNSNQNIKLDNLKNLLLNKLMSGQIDVDKLNIDWDKLDKTLKEVENLV